MQTSAAGAGTAAPRKVLPSWLHCQRSSLPSNSQVKDASRAAIGVLVFAALAFHAYLLHWRSADLEDHMAQGFQVQRFVMAELQLPGQDSDEMQHAKHKLACSLCQNADQPCMLLALQRLHCSTTGGTAAVAHTKQSQVC